MGHISNEVSTTFFLFFLAIVWRFFFLKINYSLQRRLTNKHVIPFAFRLHRDFYSLAPYANVNRWIAASTFDWYISLCMQLNSTYEFVSNYKLQLFYQILQMVEIMLFGAPNPRNSFRQFAFDSSRSRSQTVWLFFRRLWTSYCNVRRKKKEKNMLNSLSACKFNWLALYKGTIFSPSYWLNLAHLRFIMTYASN